MNLRLAGGKSALWHRRHGHHQSSKSAPFPLQDSKESGWILAFFPILTACTLAQVGGRQREKEQDEQGEEAGTDSDSIHTRVSDGLFPMISSLGFLLSLKSTLKEARTCPRLRTSPSQCTYLPAHLGSTYPPSVCRFHNLVN